MLICFNDSPALFLPPAIISDCFVKDKGPWIIKPVASSRGRGIYLVSNVSRLGFHLSLRLSKSPVERKKNPNTTRHERLYLKERNHDSWVKPVVSGSQKIKNVTWMTTL